MMRNGFQKEYPQKICRKDVTVVMPSLDLFGETKKINDQFRQKKEMMKDSAGCCKITRPWKHGDYQLGLGPSKRIRW